MTNVTFIKDFSVLSIMACCVFDLHFNTINGQKTCFKITTAMTTDVSYCRCVSGLSLCLVNWCQTGNQKLYYNNMYTKSCSAEYSGIGVFSRGSTALVSPD